MRFEIGSAKAAIVTSLQGKWHEGWVFEFWQFILDCEGWQFRRCVNRWFARRCNCNVAVVAFSSDLCSSLALHAAPAFALNQFSIKRLVRAECTTARRVGRRVRPIPRAAVHQAQSPDREKRRTDQCKGRLSCSSFSTFKSYKWDPQRSSRWNQDAQREEGNGSESLSSWAIFCSLKPRLHFAHKTCPSLPRTRLSSCKTGCNKTPLG